MVAGYSEIKFSELLSAVHDFESAVWASIFGAATVVQQLGAKCRGVARPIRDHATLQSWKQPTQALVVLAGNDYTIKGNPIHEIDERLLHIIHIAIAIHVLAIDVRNDRQNRRELQKRPVALICFGAGDVLRTMPNKDDGPQTCEALRHGRLAQI